MGRKAKKVISIFLTVVLLFITVPSIEQSNMKTVKAASYNTIAAVNYAMTWGGSKRNPAYKIHLQTDRLHVNTPESNLLDCGC